MVNPTGWLKRAAAPVPSAEPDVPAVPANVVTAPPTITTLRMVWLPESATYKFVPSLTMPVGVLNLADVPVASVVPEVPAVPAKVVATPPVVTLRMGG